MRNRRVAWSTWLVTACLGACARAPVASAPEVALEPPPAPLAWHGRAPAAPVTVPSAAPSLEASEPTVPKAPVRIAFTSDRADRGDLDLYVYEPDSQTVLAIPGANTDGDEICPSLILESRWLLYETTPPGGDADLRLFDMEHQVVDLLTTLNTEADEFSSAITGDGTLIAFLRGTPEGNQVRLFHVPTRTELVPAALRNYGGDVRSVNLSGDGKRLVLSIAAEGAGFDIVIYDLAEGWVRLPPFVNGPADEISPALSADGKTLIYSSDRRGSFDAYVTELDTGITDDLPLLNSPGFEFLARFYDGMDRILVNSDRTGVFQFYMYDRRRHTLDLLPVANVAGFDSFR